MKLHFRKWICAFLAVALCFCAVTPAFAADAAPAETQTGDAAYPLVLVRGMDFDGLYDDPAFTQKSFKGITFGGVMKTLWKTFTGTFRSGFYDALAVAAVDYCYDLMGTMAMDENGDSVYEVREDARNGRISENERLLKLMDEKEATDEEAFLITAGKALGYDNVYFYEYDFRLDPYLLADEVHAMIEKAKADHGCDKVDLVNCSMGGVITDAYLYKYGNESLHKVTFISSTFCGTDMATDLFRGKVEITEQTLYNFLVRFLGETFLPKALKKTGLLSGVAKFAMKFVEKEKDYVFSTFLLDVFGTMPSFWANVQPDQLEECIAYMFPTEEMQQHYAGAIERARRMGRVMATMPETLTALPENGTQVAVLGSYNLSVVPVYESAKYQGDGILDSRYVLGRAEVSEIGGRLPETDDPNRLAYRSADGCIDLSCALFPDNTFVIRDADHVPCVTDTDLARLFEWIITTDQVTNNMEGGYPAFMVMNKKTHALSKLQ